VTGERSLRPVDARPFFPGAERSTYMDVAVRGLLSSETRRAVDRFLDEHMYEGGNKARMFETVERARRRFAELIGAASPDEIAITKNVSDGLNMIAGALPWRDGDNVVLCPVLEHPNNVYPWLNVARRAAVEVKAVPPRDGHVPVEDLLGAMDARTRLVTVPSVTFSPGFITRTAPLAEACRQRGVLFLVDAAQSVGVLHTDVTALGADALAVATQKGLLAFYGFGFLYCRREWAQRLSPVALARFGVNLGGDAHETALGRGELVLAPAARRFDLGNYNYIGAAAADASLALLQEIGTQAVEAYVRPLAARLACGLLELGLPVVGGPPGPDLAHIVALGAAGQGRHDTAEDPALNDLYGFLTGQGVRLSIRRGVLRFSLHLYNNEADVDRVVALAREWMTRRIRD